MADQSYFTDDDVISALDKSYKLRNELASKAGKPDAMQDKNLEIGLGDAGAAITGSLLSNVGTGIKEASIGDMTRAARKVADGSFVKGAVDAAVSGITDKSSEELSKKGLLTDALGLDGVGFVGIDPSENPVKEAASTFLNKAADTGEYVADKLDSYAVNPVAEVVGGGVKAAGDGIKDWMSDDAKEAAKSSAYTQDENGDFHLGNMWSDPARASIKLLDSIGSMGGTVVAGLLTGGAVKGMVMRTMLKRGASEGIAKQTAEMAAQKWSERAVAGEAMSMSVGQAADQSRESYGQLSNDDKLNSPIFGDTVKSVYEQHPELSSSQRMAIVDERMRDKMASFAKSDPSTYAAAAAGTMLGDSMLFKMVTGKAGASEVTGGLLSRAAQGFAKGGLGEGVGEAVEEGVQQNVQNRASNVIGGTNIDPMQGVALAAAEAGTMGALTGGAVGSVSSVAHGSSKPAQPSESPEQQGGDAQSQPDTPQAADESQTAPVVDGVPDMETAINEVYGDDVQTKVPGSFSIGKDESGYRAAYVDDNGELQVSEPYATPDEAQKIVTGGQVIRQDVSQAMQPTNEIQQPNEGAETTQPLEVEPQTAIDGQDQAAPEANQQLPVDGLQNINALQAELPAIPTQPEQAPTNSNDIFGQLTTVRVTKRGKPFASQKEAQLASRKTETPIKLPTGGFGVVDKTELEQVQASQNQSLITTQQADVNDTNVADINQAADPVDVNESMQNQVVAQNQPDINVNEQPVSQAAVKQFATDTSIPYNEQTQVAPQEETPIVATRPELPWTGFKDKADGTMILEGDPVALKAWAKENDITAIKSKTGIVVGRGSVPMVKDFISKQQETGNVTSNGQLSTVPGISDVAASNNTEGHATVGELVTGEQSGNTNSAITDVNNAEAAVVEPGRNGRDNALTNQEVLNSKFFDTADKGGFSLSAMPKNDAEISGNGMTKPEAAVVAKQWLRQFKTNINVAVVKDQTEFESALADRGFANSIQSGEMDNAAYLPDSKTILINASAIHNPKRLKQIMRHEILVHHGLRYVVGEDAYAKIINAIAQGYKTSPVIKAAVDTVTKNYADKDMFTQMEEAFAHYAENIPADSGPIGRLWQRIISMIKSALQKVNFISTNEAEQQLDSVLNAIARNMRKGIEDGVLAERSDEAMFSKKSPADIASVDGSQLGAVEKILKLSGSRLINFVKEQRGYGLGALSDRQIDQVYKGVTGGAVSRYQKLRTQMEADRNDILLDAETRIDPLWSALKKDPKAALSTLMHDATMSKLHPDIPLADNTWYQEAKTRLYKARKPETKALYQQELDIIKENYKNIAERYTLTSKEGKELYQVMKETYNKQWEDLRNAIELRIEDVMGEGGKAISAELRLKMEQSLKHGPYFPLARFGDYVVRAKKGDQFIREHFEKRRDAERAMQSYQSDGYKSTMTVKEEKTGGSATAHDLGMKVMELLDNAKNENSNPSQLKDSVWQAMLEVLPDASYAKHAIHRKRIKGASRDGHRAFLNSVYHYAFHVSKIRYGHKMKAELDQMNDNLQATLQGEPSAIKEDDLEVAQQVLNEMHKRHELNMNPKGSSIAGAIGNIGFLWYLGASPASAVINLTQNAMVMLPQLAGKFGYAKSAKFMLKAMSDYARHGVFKKGTKEAWVSLTRATKGISADEKAMLNELYRAGVLDLTQAHSVAARADTDQQNISKSSVFSQKAMQLSGAMFHNAEVLNREVAALTAYRLLKEQQPNLSNEATLDQVTEMVYDGHGDYAASNRPRYMRGDVAKVLTQFKIYSQMMTFTLTRNAILAAKGDKQAMKTLGALLGSTFVMAGMMGLPTPVSLLLYGIAAAFDDDDDRTAEASFRLGLSEVFGPDVGELIAKGPINSITGLSIADRTGLGDLWWRSPKEGAEGDDLVFHYLQQVAGPALGIGISATRGLRSFADGEIQRGVEAISPKAIKDIAKAYRQSSEGERTRNGDSIIDDVPAWNVAMQSMGFSSAKMSQVYAARGYIKGKEKVIEDERSNLLADFFDAKRSGDEEVMRDVMERIKAFNSKHDRAETITGRTLMQSIKSRNRSMERTQAGVYLSKKREYLRGEGAFLADEDDDE